MSVSATSFLMPNTLGEPSSLAKYSGFSPRGLPMYSVRGDIAFGPVKWIVTAAVGLSSPSAPPATLTAACPSGPSSACIASATAGGGGSGRYSVACSSARSLNRFFAFSWSASAFTGSVRANVVFVVPTFSSSRNVALLAGDDDGVHAVVAEVEQLQGPVRPRRPGLTSA